MYSLHTLTSTPAAVLLKNGATITRVKDSRKLARVEFPARDDVGSIGGVWAIEESDKDALADLLVEE